MDKESKFHSVSWQENDKVVKNAIAFMTRGQQKFDTYVTLQEKLDKAYNKTFDISKIDIGQKTKIPNIYLSALGRIETEIFKKSIKFPVPEIIATSRRDPKKNERGALEVASIAMGLIKWGVRESFVESVFNRCKETWIAFGDVFLQFFIRKGKKRNMIGFEFRDGSSVILDPDGKLLDPGTPVEQTQAKYDRSILTREQVISKFGKWALDYAKPGSHFKTITLENGNSAGADYYELNEGMNIADEEEVSLLGSNAFPVTRYAEDESFKEKFVKEFGKVEYEKLKKSVSHGDKYRYTDSLGNPYINSSQLFCYYDKKNPTNYGVQQKIYALQYIHELTENAKIDSFRKETESLTYASGIRPATFRAIQEDYRAEKDLDILSTMVLPPSVQSQNPKIEVLTYPTINPLTAKQMTEDILRLTRNTVGADPNRLEIQKNEGLGLREQLMEERTEAVLDIVDDNLLSFTKLFEKLLNFIIVHEGFGLNDVFIDFEKQMTSGSGVEFVNKSARISIVEAAKRLKSEEWDLHISITKDSLIKKSNALLLERVLSFMERVNPEMFPDLYKKLILSLNDLLPTNIVAEDIVQQAPSKALGGASQYQSGGNGLPTPPSTPGQVGAIQQGPGNIGAPGNVPLQSGPPLVNAPR